MRLQELAAILRFADELAEGPQRTSNFMRELELYDEDSKIYHDYAASTNISIQRNNGRIALTYEIDIDIKSPNEVRRPHLSSFLQFVYERIKKLNQERQYARYYSEFLEPFKLIEATINFHCGSDILDTELSPLQLTDLVVPGDQTKDISAIDPAYSINELVDDLLAQC